jgi:hypothetical protein
VILARGSDAPIFSEHPKGPYAQRGFLAVPCPIQEYRQMRFVHLAPRKVIGLIKRNGLRTGAGVRGVGVYAAPLFHTPVVSTAEFESTRPADLLVSNAVSSSRLWKHLFRHSKTKYSQRVEVVFSPPQNCWPLDLYLELPAEVAQKLLAKLDSEHVDGVTIDEATRSCAEDALLDGYVCELSMSVSTGQALGRVLHHFREAGGLIWSDRGEPIEVVFRRPIPPNAIERVVPLYRTNGQFRQAK